MCNAKKKLTIQINNVFIHYHLLWFATFYNWIASVSPVCTPCCCPHWVSRRCPRCSDGPGEAASVHHKTKWRPKSDHQRSSQTPVQMHCCSETLNERKNSVNEWIHAHFHFIIGVFHLSVHFHWIKMHSFYFLCKV